MHPSPHPTPTLSSPPPSYRHAADCKFHDTRLQLFSAIMFLSGAVVAVPAGAAARMFGRKVRGCGCARGED